MRPPDAAAGRDRFHRYIEMFADGDAPALRGVYPDLAGQPWYEAQDFPLARYLESHYEEIRAEILALDPSIFHPESERIGRSGDWGVAFFYERGRRHHEVCGACPVTTRAIESHRDVRTLAGLIYASRMRAGTHIAPHRGPTNLRLRCHLGIAIPGGDCAIRVGDETRRWEAGRCLVFDDHFEHEAWNHTDEDRLVLIVDVWHPDLTADEVRLLEGLQGYAFTAAGQLTRYWSANAAARADCRLPRRRGQGSDRRLTSRRRHRPQSRRRRRRPPSHRRRRRRRLHRPRRRRRRTVHRPARRAEAEPGAESRAHQQCCSAGRRRRTR